jgi:hypothetical protein
MHLNITDTIAIIKENVTTSAIDNSTTNAYTVGVASLLLTALTIAACNYFGHISEAEPLPAAQEDTPASMWKETHSEPNFESITPIESKEEIDSVIQAEPLPVAQEDNSALMWEETRPEPDFESITPMESKEEIDSVIQAEHLQVAQEDNPSSMWKEARPESAFESITPVESNDEIDSVRQF